LYSGTVAGKIQSMRAASLPLVLLGSLACACVSTDERIDDPAAKQPEAPPATAPVEREVNPVMQADGPEYYIGVAGQTGIRHCPNGNDEWLNLSPTIGFVGVGGPGSENIEKLLDRPVLARGSAGAAPESEAPKVELKPCPPMQMRDDWVVTPRGIVVDDGNRPAIEYFHTTSVRPLDELSIRREGDEIVVELRNPLPFAIAQIGLSLRYEGCYGKPGSQTIRRDVGPLAVGEVRTERFPIFAEKLDDGQKGGKQRRHRAHSLALIGELSGEATVHLDLDVTLAAMGVTVDCPE
jgi:hypothetical protein